jgi:dsRNA-specific ribonuclease
MSVYKKYNKHKDTRYQSLNNTTIDELGLSLSNLKIDNTVDKGEQWSPEFKEFIINLFTKLGINNKDDFIDQLTTDEHMIEWLRAFTSKYYYTTGKTFNYEFYEFMGDNIANTCITTYLAKRLNVYTMNIQGKQRLQAAMTILKNQFTSKLALSSIAHIVRMQDYIRYNPEELGLNMSSLLEDCFEAFLGCLEYLTNKITNNNYGFNVVYRIIANIFDKDEGIRFDFDNIENKQDAMTRMNNAIGVVYRHNRPKCEWEFEELADGSFITSLKLILGKEELFSYKGVKSTLNKSLGKQFAAEKVLLFLAPKLTTTSTTS